IAIVEAFNSIIAEVAEVSVDENNNITIHNMYAAVDCGLVVNPDQAVAQIQGGMLFGISSALHHEITLKGGIVEQNSFPDYPMLQMHEAPRVHVEFLESDASMGGLGEPGVPPVAPAIGNAIFAATGKRIRELPFAKTINRYS
ncbi:MAG: xanthine dehydrogenase family protein molybdopterin-binding subunit, partial [Gammaproteobacteria bacterium]|nr:xanthine dehydrogenase family protein molybdopterin-binding subunit [Gammaproteobacteria bacterium]